jgi:hypothetical protein
MSNTNPVSEVTVRSSCSISVSRRVSINKSWTYSNGLFLQHMYVKHYHVHLYTYHKRSHPLSATLLGQCTFIVLAALAFKVIRPVTISLLKVMHMLHNLWSSMRYTVLENRNNWFRDLTSSDQYFSYVHDENKVRNNILCRPKVDCNELNVECFDFHRKQHYMNTIGYFCLAINDHY